MNDAHVSKVLFVDDEPGMREVMAMLLSEEGYEVLTASDGLDAIAQLRVSTPALVISDLNMPRMSGRELLSVVRRRFPALPVIAMSESCESSSSLPAGVMADAFYPKASCNPDELLGTVAHLIGAREEPQTNDGSCWPQEVQEVQLARAATNQDGQPSIVLNCLECLRSFSSDTTYASSSVQEAHCPFCAATIDFVAAA